jgi:hypothetical protein
VRLMSRDAPWTGKMPRVGNGNCHPRLTAGDNSEGRPRNGKSGSGHVDGGEGGRSPKEGEDLNL